MDPLFIIYLGICHRFADFICQIDWMAVNKSKRWDALILHVVVYSVVMSLLTMNGWFGIVTFGAHLATDAVTSRMGRAVFPWEPAGKDECDTMMYADLEGDTATSAWSMGLLRSRHWFFAIIGADQWLLHWPQLILTAWWLL